jgi:beta-lactamase class A
LVMLARRTRLLTILLATAAPAVAGAAAPDNGPASAPAAVAPSAFLIPLLNGETDPATLFSSDMLRQVPATQLSAAFAQLRAQFGKALAVDGLEVKSPTTTLVTVRMERAHLHLRMTTDAQPPKRLTGLIVDSVDRPGDSQAAVVAEFATLPGKVTLGVAALSDTGPVFLSQSGGERPTAIGSTFKLFVLAELVRQIRAGERKWSDVVALDHRSLPSGILQDWPTGAPMTLYSLAALMISRSDNSAADTLLHLVGREKVEALLPALGVQAAARNRPFPSTRELFAIKADPALTERWTTADEAGRRAMLPGLETSPIDGAALAGPPKAIETIEWFASAEDVIRTMDWLRRNADPTALAILAINPGIGAGAAAGFDYFGYKGGSETGVIQMTFLLQRKDGEWRGVAASWNNPAAAIDEDRFVALVARLVALQK